MFKDKRSKFFVRLLPTEDVDWENIKIESNKEVIHVRCLQELKANKASIPPLKGKDTKPRFWSFQTDGIFYNANQETLYQTVMEGVISSIYDGMSSIIMALGQTFSGKSFTMGAIRSLYEYRGLLPRFLSAVFSDIESKTKEWKVSVGISFIEVMGHTIHDLLSKTPTVNCDIKNVSVHKVKTGEKALSLMFKGESLRRVTSNAPYLGANCASGIFTFRFEVLSLIRSHAFINQAEVHFIDLAGIETVGKRDLTSFKSAIDQGYANQAKYDLEQVIVNMEKDYHGDQRVKTTCKLAEYLHSSLSRGCILRLIGHIRPTYLDLEVTLSTLKFGLKVKRIQTVPITNYSEPNSELMFQNMKEELNQLKEQILVEKLLSGSHEVESGNFSEARLRHLERLANAYLQGWSSEVNVLGNTEHIIILKIFKQLFEKKNEEYENLVKEARLFSSQVDIEAKPSRSSYLAKKSKEELEQLSKNQNRKRSTTKDKKGPNKLGTSSGKVPAHSSSSFPVCDKETMTDAEKKQENVIMSLKEVITDDSNEKLIWEEFLFEEHIDQKYLDDLADLIENSKKFYESAANDYNETRINLERNRLTLKELGWKRHAGQNEMYDRFGQIVITQEERSIAKLVSNLEFEERNAKKVLEEKHLEWKEAAQNFLQEKLKIEDKFKAFYRSKHAQSVPPNINKFGRPREADSGHSRETTKKDSMMCNYYYFLQKKLFEKEVKKRIQRQS